MSVNTHTTPAGTIERPKGPSLARLAGVEGAKRFGEALAIDLAEYKAGHIEWSDIDPGCLLYGPPGTGKTTVARAIAAHCSAAFISTSYAVWTQGGENSSDMINRMRESFDLARKSAPCILFIDEIDSFPRRGYGGPNAGYFMVLNNALLTEIGGSRGVVVIAACNDPSNLDPALIRSGRLDQMIEVPLPAPKALPDIFRYHLGRDAPHLRELDRLALLCAGKSGADVASIVRKSRRIARTRKVPLADEHLEQAINEDVRKLSAAQRRIVAVHEAGHAAVAYRQNPHQEITVSIASGATARAISRDDSLKTRDQIEQDLIVLLAGRAAEEILLGHVSGGAGGTENSDLARATAIALEAIARRGLSAQGRLIWIARNSVPGLVENTYGAEADDWLSDAYQAAVAQVRHEAVFVAMIAYALLDRGVLTNADIIHIDRTMEKVAEARTKTEMLSALGFAQAERVALQ